MSLILPPMWSMDCLVVKVLKKIISLICFRVYLEVIVFKNPTCFSRWSVRDGWNINTEFDTIEDAYAMFKLLVEGYVND